MRAILLATLAISVTGCSSFKRTERDNSWQTRECVANVLATAEAPDAPDSAFDAWVPSRNRAAWSPSSLRAVVESARLPDGRIAYRTSEGHQIVPGQDGQHAILVTFDGRDAGPIEFRLMLEGGACRLVGFVPTGSR